MHDKDQQRKKVQEILQQFSHYEVQYNKQQNFERAVMLALDETQELENEFRQFIQRIEHLEVFQFIKESFMKDMQKKIQNLKYLIEKNYTKEETEKMPEEVYRQVKASQERRIELLKKVAQKYLSRPKQD